MDIITIGKVHWDFIYKLNEENPHLFLDDYLLSPGGSATNSAIALAKLGMKAGVVGTVGHDWEILKVRLEKYGLDLSNITQTDVRTALTANKVTTVKKDILAFRGSDAMLRPEHIKKEYLDQAKIVHLASMNQHICRKALEGREFITIDPGYEFSIENFEEVKDILAKTKYIFPTDYELTRLTGEKDMEKSIQMVLDADVGMIVLKKPEVVELITKEKRISIPVIRGNVHDVTGCGDVFAAGFLYGHLNGKSDEEACKFGIMCSKLKCEKMGGTSSPTLEEAQKEFEKHY